MNEHAFSFSIARLSDYSELAKLRLVSLVLLSSAVGFFLAGSGPINAPLFFISLLGTGLVAAGSMTLNQWIERAEDSKMTRTATRPLPAGRMQALEAFIFGIILSAAGLGILIVAVNMCAAFLAGLTLVSYTLLYTPLKRYTSLCTIIGAVPGALPPLIGWAAIADRPSFEAWILFAILFLWQMPHFLTIAWFCRNDYAAAGFRMLSVEDPTGMRVARQIVLYSMALLPVSLLPTVAGLTGPVYFFGALVSGIFFIFLGIKSFKNLDQKARMLFRASILHLAFLLILMVLDKA